MAQMIFLSYRRDDSIHQASHLVEHLSKHFVVFMDVDSILLGLDFRRVLSEKLKECAILLALIGDTWLNSARGTRRRIDDPEDYVRIEIETALGRKIPVIPVLVGRDLMFELKADDLPKELHLLASHQRFQVRPEYFRHDVQLLIQGISKVLRDQTTPSGPTTLVGLPSPPLPVSASSKHQPVVTLGPHLLKYLHDKLRKPLAPDTLEQATTRVPESVVRIGILKSSNATYVIEIDRIFLANLTMRLSGKRVRLDESQEIIEWGEKESQWVKSAQRLLARGGDEGFHFLVAIGTQASTGLNKALGTAYGKVPTLLLGVTYPLQSCLVDSELSRCEDRQVIAVRYGCGLDTVASLLHHRIFPNRALCFVFKANVPQDEIAWKELSNTRLAHAGLLHHCRLTHKLKPEDLKDPETVYFSWNTFTRWFHGDESIILSKHLTVSVMQDNVSDRLATVGIGTDHDWIGNCGAELIDKYLAAPEGAKPGWGSQDVINSPLVYWLHRGLAREHGIEFSQAAQDGARRIYD